MGPRILDALPSVRGCLAAELLLLKIVAHQSQFLLSWVVQNFFFAHASL